MGFEHLQTICLPVGFSGTANQPLAYALTAHPNVVMSNQRNLLISCLDTNKSPDEFLSRILEMNHKMKMNEISYKRVRRHYFIDGQWQGRFERLTVIGDCSPKSNTRVLTERHYNWKILKFIYSVKVPLKFIFLVRNPYDMISSETISSYEVKTRAEIFDNKVNKFIHECAIRKRLLRRVSWILGKRAFIWRTEDHIANPRQKLAELCEFLNIKSTESYLDACAKIFYKNYDKSRYLIDWPEEYKVRVAKAIGQYDFLSGYGWDS